MHAERRIGPGLTRGIVAARDGFVHLWGSVQAIQIPAPLVEPVNSYSREWTVNLITRAQNFYGLRFA